MFDCLRQFPDAGKQGGLIYRDDRSSAISQVPSGAMHPVGPLCLYDLLVASAPALLVPPNSCVRYCELFCICAISVLSAVNCALY